MLVALMLAGCGRATEGPTQVVEGGPAQKVSLPIPRADRIPAPRPEVFTPKPDTVPSSPPPRIVDPPVPSEQPPRPVFKPESEDPKTTRLRVEGIEFPDPAYRSHRLITFAAESGISSRAAGALRDRDSKAIAELPAAKAGETAWLYLIWGYYPNPTFLVGEVQARFDPRTATIRIVLPDWTARPSSGIGLDWSRYRDSKDRWRYVGCRIQLKDLEAGDYSFEIAERDPKALPGEKLRNLTTGQFKLAR